jgi:hypothetical protein
MPSPLPALNADHLPERNALAATIIAASATQAATAKAGMSFEGDATFLAAFGAGQFVDESLARDLTFVYAAPREDISRCLASNGAPPAVPIDVKAELAGLFETKFLAEVGLDLLQEMGRWDVPAFPSRLAAAISITLLASVAATATWRLGVMISIYHQNGGRWIVSRTETYQRAKAMVAGGLSPGVASRANLDDIRLNISEIRDYQTDIAADLVASVLRYAPATHHKMLRRELREQGFPAPIIEAALGKALAFAPGIGQQSDQERKSAGSPLPSSEKLAAAYRIVAAEVDADIHTLRRQVATRLQPHFCAYVATLPQDTIDAKRSVAKWVSDEMRSRGLALKCPNTGAASLLQVDPGDYPDVGRFQFYHWEDGNQVKSASRTVLPSIEVVPADTSLTPQEPLEAGRWAATESRRRASRAPRRKN